MKILVPGLLLVLASAAQAQATFGEKIWWASDHNRMAAEVSRAAGVPHPGIPFQTPAGGVPFKSGAIVPNPGSWPSGAMKGNLPGGGPVIDVNAKFKARAVGDAFGRFAKKAMPIAGTAYAIYDLAEELGFFTRTNSDGSKDFTEVNATCGSPSPTSCTEYRYSDGSRIGVWSSNRQTSCTTFAEKWNVTNPAGAPYTGVINNVTYCAVMTKAGTQAYNMQHSTRTSANVVTQTNKSVDDIADSIASQSGWPSSSTVGDAIKEILGSGESIETDTPTVSGPASKVVSKTTTNNPTNNTTNTSTTTNNYTYEGNKVTVTTQTTNVTVNNTTGETTTETVTEEKETPVDEKPDYTSSDTPLPAQPSLYERKYPDGLVGVWNDKKASLSATSLVQLTSTLMPSVGANGSCPSWMLPLDVGVASYGSWDVAPPCWVWDFGKVIIICSALLLARGLIFGG